MKLELLHNFIVKDNLKEQNGRVIKEMGDAVLAYFEQKDAAIRAAIQIQNSFNIYNLLFPSRQLHTKIAITVSEERELYKVCSHCSLFDKAEYQSTEDFLGTAMDEVARIQEQARPDEILVSARVKGSSRSTRELEPLDANDESRLKALRGLGKVELFRVPFVPFPAVAQKPQIELVNQGRESSGENSEELVAVFPVSKTKEILGDFAGQQIPRLVSSRIQALPKLSKFFRSSGGGEERLFFDAIAIGQSLSLWTGYFDQTGSREAFEGRDIRFRGVRLKVKDKETKNALGALVADDVELNKQLKKIADSRRHILGLPIRNRARLIRFFESKFTLPESTRGCFSVSAEELIKRSGNSHKTFKLNYPTIAMALFEKTEKKARAVFSRITKGGKDPTIEISMQELIFADGNGLNFLSTMDWANACRFEANANGNEKFSAESSKSLYIRARKQTERIIRHADTIE